MPSVVDQTVRRELDLRSAEEPRNVIVLEGTFPSEPIDAIDPTNLPKELVGAYLIG